MNMSSSSSCDEEPVKKKHRSTVYRQRKKREKMELEVLALSSTKASTSQAGNGKVLHEPPECEEINDGSINYSLSQGKLSQSDNCEDSEYVKVTNDGSDDSEEYLMEVNEFEKTSETENETIAHFMDENRDNETESEEVHVEFESTSETENETIAHFMDENRERNNETESEEELHEEEVRDEVDNANAFGGNPDDSSPDSSDSDSDHGGGGNGGLFNGDSDGDDDAAYNDDSDNPDDPDDPGHGGGNGDEQDNGENIDENGENFGFALRELQALCRTIRDCSAKEALAMACAVLVRHNLPYAALIHMLIIINTTLGADYLPSSKKLLWRALNRKCLGQVKHAYCRRCKRGLGLYQNLPDNVICRCRLALPKARVSFFVEMSLARQLSFFLQKPNAANLLYSRLRRQKRFENSLEDVYDGAYYKLMQEEGGPLADPNNFSYNFNTDGFRATTTSNIQVWPIYVRLNEIPMKVRQKHLFLVGVWIGRGDPDMNLFLSGFVAQANRLAATGLDWRPYGGNVVNSKFIPMCCTVDSKARCVMLNMVPPTGYFSCNFCNIQGVQANGVKFPIEPPNQQPLPPVVPRSDAMMRNDMNNAHQLQVRQQGIEGLSMLMNLEHFDLVNGFSTDDLHPIFEGAIKFHMSLLLVNGNAAYEIGTPQNIALINHRLRTIRVPTLLSRVPRDVSLMKKWRGHEWRNWLLYYCIPCLQGILVNQDHMNLLKMLSRATFLMSKDAIMEEDLIEAERCFYQYNVHFQRMFGVRHMKYTIHILTHIVSVVRQFGPLYCHSTYNFESWNMKMKKHINSMNAPINQLVTRHLLHSFIESVPDNEEFCQRVRLVVTEILDGVNRKNAIQVGDVYLLGRGVQRLPTVREQAILEEKGIQCAAMEEYNRVLCHRLELRSLGYTVPGMNNNTKIYTWDDMFCLIECIVKITTPEGEIKCYLCVKVYHAIAPLENLPHVVSLNFNEDEPMNDIIPIECVRSLAVNVVSAGRSYIMPMPNCVEID